MTTCGCEIGRCRETPTPREVEDREIRKLCGMSDVGQTLDGVRRLLARVEKAENELKELRFEHQIVLRTVRVERFKP